MTNLIPERVPSWLGFVLAVNVGLLTTHAQVKPKQVNIRVRETAGMRRFGYPVTLKIRIPAGQLRETRHARLLNSDGKPIAAQITTIQKHPDGSVETLEVDLNLSPGALETTDLRLEYGDNVIAVEPKQGLQFDETEDAYQVSAYTVRKDASPLISSVRYGREYLKRGGLNVTAWNGDTPLSLESADRKWTVEKKGPFQVRLRCDGTYRGYGNGAELPFTLTLEFVSTKSWIGLRHSVHTTAPPELPLSLGVTADFQLAGRLLWDLDTGYWLYGVLEASERMVFAQESNGWSCRLGKVGEESVYAVSTKAYHSARGWGHVQEARENGNVVAFGFGGQAVNANYSSTLGGDGVLQLRSQPLNAKSAQLTAFFHFIPVPAQHTARTSPAAMMSPLEVSVSAE